MRCHAFGRLKHHFWGEYHSTIVLVFDSSDELDAALDSGKFKAWGRSEKRPETVITWFGKDKELESVIDELVSCGAEREGIDSIAKSIDFGEPFEVDFEVDDPKQASLFPGGA